MIRKGQKLCNYILDRGYARENVHIKLFHMSDEEFDRVVNMDVNYEIPDNEEVDKMVDKAATEIIKSILEKIDTNDRM